MARKTLEENRQSRIEAREKKLSEKAKIQEQIDKLTEEIKEIDEKILLRDASKSKTILNYPDVSLSEISEALKRGDFEYLQKVHNQLNKEEVITEQATTEQNAN